MSEARILVVEDKKIVAMDIQRSLESLGYRFCGSVASGEEAVFRVEEARPDLVLMDIMLDGEMDGIQAAGAIRSRFGIPVIYLTAYADEDTLRQAMETEPFGYLLKPFEDRELGTAIEIALYKHRMESKLREHEQWLAKTLDSIGGAVVATDAEGLIRLANPVARELTGWTEQDMLGRSLPEVFQGKDGDRAHWCERIVEQVYHCRQPVSLSDTVLKSRDGKEFIIGGNVAPISDEKERIMGVVLVFRDLTEARSREEELLRSQKLQLVEGLAGNIAQGFNNILTTIIGYLSLIQIDAKEEREIRANLEKARQACFMAKDLTRQLLNLSRGDNPVKETAFISKIVRDSALQGLRGTSVRSRMTIPEDLWPVEIDKGLIRQALTHLVIHAGQSCPENGSIQVRVANVTVLPSHRLSIDSGKYVKISIQDQNSGVSEEYVQKMFDPSFMVKEGGGGLGLAMIYSIIRGHDGYVTAESRNGEGLVIHVYLPASEKKVVENRYMEGNFPVGKGKVLLMDDEEMVRDMVARVLRYLGYEVDLASNGEEVMDAYGKSIEGEERYDAVIMDLTSYDEKEARRILERLKGVEPQVKAILSGSYPNAPLMLDYRELGFCDVVTKPYQVEDLIGTLSKVITEGGAPHGAF